MAKVIHVSGTRKRAKARATLRAGRGVIKINNLLLEHFTPKLAMMKIKEPLVLAGSLAENIDVSVKTNGGGIMSQAEAARLAIARAIIEFSKDKKLKEEFLRYDRHLLVADVRRKETRKPNRHGKARAKKQKSYR